MNPLFRVAVPPGVVRVTVCTPKVPAGVLKVIWVELINFKLVTEFPPIFTVVMVGEKLLPFKVTAVPPAILPPLGVKVPMAGVSK